VLTFVRSLGVLLMLAAFASVLQAFGYIRLPPKFIVLITRYGPGAAWVIRGGLLALGAALYFAPPTGDEDRRS